MAKDSDDFLKYAAHGAMPSRRYLKRIEALDGLVSECIVVSNAYSNIPAPSAKHYYASVLLTAMIGRAVSLLIAAPHSRWANKLVEHWDYATLTGIVRTMLEVRIAFYYLCVEKCSEDEWNCRWNIFNVHDCLSRKKLFDAMNETKDTALFETQAEDLRDRLRSNTFFANLAPGQQKNLLTGKTAYLSSLEEIGERAGIDRKDFKLLYVLFSSHVHGLPMSFYRIGEERGRGLPTPTEENYTTLCLSFALNLLVRMRDEFRVMFVDFKDREKIR